MILCLCRWLESETGFIIRTMRVLMLCSKYPLDVRNRYMTNELAGALVAAGHHVQVVATNWDAECVTPVTATRSPDGVNVLVVAPRAVTGFGLFMKRASKWLLSSVFALREMRRTLSAQSFDALICFTPCVTVAAQLQWATSHFGTRNVLFVHDFFPYHHRAIGLIPAGPVFLVAKWLEERLLRRFHVIACMSSMNVTYLRDHYRTRADQRLEVHPIWGDISPPHLINRERARAEHKLPLDKIIAVFGGQLTEGRGVETILEAARILKWDRPNIAFLLIGDGRYAGWAGSRATDADENVFYRRRIPRDNYLSLISACDIGIICTVAGVGVPTFPSKLIDYLRAGLPVVAAVESTTDFGCFVEENKVGIALAADDAPALAGAIRRIADDHNLAARMAQAARPCLNNVFDVRQAVARVEQALAT